MASSTPVVLITGAAHRLGAHTARHLHQRGWNLVIHYRSREADANALRDELNNIRQESAVAIQADLAAPDQIELLARKAVSTWARLDGLVNNASVFYPNPTHDASPGDWDAIMNTNLRAPFFLGQACLPALKQSQGAIVNLIDIYSQRPLADHPLYCSSKSGLASLTLSWAKDLAPEVRVNGVSPGAILWPEQGQENQQDILDATALGRAGDPDDIAATVAWLALEAPYITGQILAVDGGRSLSFPGG